ncbi:ciliary-associated calcium-binding coiled-coil protein 1 [Limanda limanda]|uniref:ciliary-associated calcium-binding coiled-coil protein 1 n=1 Tax=Limanda limanda TaxID=27771 RepID=UPI0029C89411|nr:ciliary-associated calcium-binding coiled-coil protein 1 [Limanda limanda]
MSGARRREKKEPVKVEESEPQRATPAYLMWDEPPHLRTAELQRKTPEELELELKEILGLRNYKRCMRDGGLLDFYVLGFWWTNEQKFSPAQTSFTMAVLQMLIDNIKEKQMTMVQNMLAFAQALIPATQRVISGGETTSLLSIEEGKELIGYVVDSLFQNHRLYKVVLTTPREEIVVSLERTIEVFEGLFEPLSEGVSSVLPEVTTHVSLP